MEAGVTDRPWDSDKVFSIASGDDNVIWSHPVCTDSIYQSVMNLCSRTTESQIVGLG